MRPLTDRIPKALIEIGGKPFLDHILTGLLRQDRIGRLALIVNHIADRIAEHVSKHFPDADISLVRQENPHGIADAFLRVRDWAKSDFLAVHTDNLFAPDVFGDLIDHHVEGAITMVTVPYEGRSPRNRGRLALTTGQLRLACGEDSSSEGIDVQTTGCCILPVGMFPLLQEAVIHDPSTDVYDVLCRHQRELNLTGVLFEGIWTNVNTQDDLRQLDAQLAQERV